MKKSIFLFILFFVINVNHIYPKNTNNFSIHSYVGNFLSFTGIKNHNYCVINNATGDTIFDSQSALYPVRKYYCINEDTLIHINIINKSQIYRAPSTIEITKYQLLSSDVKLICSKSIENKFYCDVCLNDFYFDDIKIIMSNYIDWDNNESIVKRIRCITISKVDLSIIEDVEYDLIEKEVKN